LIRRYFTLIRRYFTLIRRRHKFARINGVCAALFHLDSAQTQIRAHQRRLRCFISL